MLAGQVPACYTSHCICGISNAALHSTAHFFVYGCQPEVRSKCAEYGLALLTDVARRIVNNECDDPLPDADTEEEEWDYPGCETEEGWEKAPGSDAAPPAIPSHTQHLSGKCQPYVHPKHCWPPQMPISHTLTISGTTVASDASCKQYLACRSANAVMMYVQCWGQHTAYICME